MSKKFYSWLTNPEKPSKRTTSLAIVVFLLMFSAFIVFQFPHDSAAFTGKSSSLVTQESVPLTQSLTLRTGDYDYFEADSFSNNTYVSYNVSSDVSISTAIMTAAQLNDFANNASDPISNSITYQNGTSVNRTVQIAPGQNFLVFYNPPNTYDSSYSRANIEFGYIVTPNTPLSYGPVQGPFASGIASFGIANNSGVVTPYEVQTNEIVGVANISAMEVYTADAGQYGVTVTGATLQLNSELVVNNSGSSTPNVYWVQNVPDFVTGTSQVSFGDEIWNWTDLTGYLSNQSVISTNFQNGGAVYPTGSNKAAYVYNYNGANQTYALPLNFALLENESVLRGTGVLVQLGYLSTANGTATSSNINWFDNVTIVDPNVQSAYFEISGNAVPPIGLYYDTELVFGGEGNGEMADFTQLSASLGLFYQNATNPSGILSSFPTYYDFSGDTGESASDLVISYSNGISSVGTGLVPNYSYLGNASLTLNLKSLNSTTTSSTTTSSTTTTTSTNQTSTTTTTSSSSSTTQSQTTSSSSTTTTTTSSPITSVGPSTSTNQNSNSSSSSSSSSTSETTTTTSATKENSEGMPATFEWIAAGIVIGVVIASLAFMALRRKPSNESPPSV